MVGAHSPPCVTKAITVAKGGLLALTEGGTVVSSNPAADEPEPTTIPFPAVSPLSLATAKGRIAATTSSGTAVTAAKLDGTLVWTAGGFERLVGVAVDSAGVVVALDAHGPTLTRLDAVTGETLFTVGPGLESAPDDSFEDLARDALGGGRERGEEGLRQVPDQEEEDQGSGVRSVISHALQSPRGVSMDMRGFVYVLERPGVEGEGGEDLPAEMGAGGEEPDGVMLGAMLEEDESAAVVVLDRDLTLVAVIDSWGDVPIREPVGIALTAEGVLLVADRGLGVVLGYDAVDSYAPLAGEM